VDEAASIAGGCICCLPDEDGLDAALSKLADPNLNLDAIIVEASGLADPVAVSRLVRYSGVERVRPGGIVDVIDAARYFDTIDRDGTPPARYAAASLVVINKLDQVSDDTRADVVARIESRVRERNPGVQTIGAVGGRIDPALLFDIDDTGGGGGQLSLREMLIDEPTTSHDHVHAHSVSVTSSGCVDPDALFRMLENPPPGVYRMKGVVAVAYRKRQRSYVVNVVGTSIHVGDAPATARPNCLVAIGTELDVSSVRAALTAALATATGTTPAAAIRRLQRYRRLSV
jgi:G3E family GTPase